MRKIKGQIAYFKINGPNLSIRVVEKTFNYGRILHIQNLKRKGKKSGRRLWEQKEKEGAENYRWLEGRYYLLTERLKLDWKDGKFLEDTNFGD